MRFLVAMFAVLFLSGCVQQHTVVKLKPDGSGTVEVTELFSKQFLAMGGDTPEGRAQIYSEAKSKAKAAVIGAEFVKVEAMKDGTFEGQKATYTFKDITTVKFEQFGADDKPQDGGAPKEPKDPVVVTFDKSDEGHHLLKLVFPKGKVKPKPKDDPKKDPAEEATQLAAMKPLFEGARFSLVIIPEGEIVKTSSEFVDGSTVTLYDIPLPELLNHPDVMKKMDESPDDPETMSKLFKELKGMKMISNNEFTLEFK